MDELLEIFDLNEKPIDVLPRKRYYDQVKKEFKITGKISTQIKIVRLLLMNSEGQIYIQKRSDEKSENPGLYDKAVGGHVTKGETPDISLKRECAEELGFAAEIVKEKDFSGSVKTTDLTVVGILKRIDYINRFESVRMIHDGKSFIHPHMSYFYIGYYDGKMRFVDGESSGIEVFSLDDLKAELEKYPEKYTEDLKFMINRYGKFIRPLR